MDAYCLTLYLGGFEFENVGVTVVKLRAEIAIENAFFNSSIGRMRRRRRCSQDLSR